VLKIPLLCTVAACAALLGCSPSVKGLADSKAKPIAPVDCNTDDKCEITVWVETCADGSSRPCLAVNNPFVVVPAGKKPTMTWELSKPNDPAHPTPMDYDFAKNDKGIVIDDPDHVFTGCKSDGPRKFVCKNTHGNALPLVFKYTVNVIDKRTLYPDPNPLDPQIFNH
jgi:hypothetical protein